VDLDRLARELLRPHETGAAVPLAVPDLLGQTEVPAGAVLVLEGAALLGARLRTGLDRLIHLDLPETVSWRRLQGRDGHLERPEPLAQALRTRLAEQRALEQRYPPRVSADLVLDGTNALGAALLTSHQAGAGLGSGLPAR
jgi:hypothetical protein